MRWKMENGAVLEDDSVNLTVRIPFDYSDCAHNAQRLKRANGTSPFGRGWFDLADRAPRRWIRDHMAFEQFVCFEIAIGPNTFLRLNHLDQLSREMRREFSHPAGVQPKAGAFAAWGEGGPPNCAFQPRWGKALFQRKPRASEFRFHLLIL